MLTEKRIEVLGQLDQGQYSVDIRDIHEKDGSCGGTNVRIKLPVIHEWEDVGETRDQAHDS